MKNARNAIYAPPALDEEMRNRILMEHMPQVRYIARHIHDRLPQHVPIEDLVHAGDPRTDGRAHQIRRKQAKCSSRPMPSSAYAAPFSTACANSTGARAICAARPAGWRRPQPRIGHELGRSATEQEIADELGLSLESFQHLLGELEGLDLGSLHIESGDKDARRRSLRVPAGQSRGEPLFALPARAS